MTEKEKNMIVMQSLFGDKKYNEEILSNRILDWDKAYSSIGYIRKSEEFESKGESVYKDIRQKCQEYIAKFSEDIIASNCFNV